MNYQKEETKWLMTDLFYLTKSYEQILEDHVLIEEMKYALNKTRMSRYFEDMIKEAYFQCGIILRRVICTNFIDYERFFFYRKSQFYYYDDSDLDKKTIACMVHLLLSKRKKLPEGVGWLVDCISSLICNKVNNPFEKLLTPGKYKHDIDFGVRAKPLDSPLWNKLNWLYDLRFLDGQDIYRIEKGTDTPEDYCNRLTNSINEVMNCFDFEDEINQLELLDKIGEKIQDKIGCIYDDCEFYHERPHKCTCDERHLALEPFYFNPLRKKVIEDMKQAVVAKFAKKRQKPEPSNIKQQGKVYLSDTVSKTDMGRIIYALCKMKAFKDKDGRILDNKEVFEEFGIFLHEDYSRPNNYAKTEIDLSDHIKIFNRMIEVFRIDQEKKMKSRKNK